MNWKVVIGILTFNVVLMSSSYTMLMPFLPIYLMEELGATQDNVSLWSGVVFAITFAVCAVMSPIWGSLGDRMGRKAMLIRSTAMMALSYLFCGLAQNPMQLVLARAFQGFSAGTWPSTLALASAYAPKEKIGITMGIIQSANISGGITGPLIGGLLANYFGTRNTFYVSFCVMLIALIIELLFIREPPKEHSVGEKKTSAGGVMMDLLRNRGIMMVMLSVLAGNTVILLLQPVTALYVSELGADPATLMITSGFICSLGGLAGAIASPLWGRAGQRSGFFRMLVLALLAGGVLTAIQCLAPSVQVYAVMMFVGGLGFSGIFPSANAMLTRLTAAGVRGTAFGLLFSAAQIGGAAGPLLGAIIATYVSLSAVFLCAGLVLMAMAALLWAIAPPQMKKEGKLIS